MYLRSIDVIQHQNECCCRNLNFNAITTIKRGAFSSLPSLDFIHLAVNGITSIEDGAFDDATLLTKLILTRNSLAALPIVNLPHLALLFVTACGTLLLITTVAVRSASTKSHLYHLEHLTELRCSLACI